MDKSAISIKTGRVQLSTVFLVLSGVIFFLISVAFIAAIYHHRQTSAIERLEEQTKEVENGIADLMNVTTYVMRYVGERMKEEYHANSSVVPSLLASFHHASEGLLPFSIVAWIPANEETVLSTAPLSFAAIHGQDYVIKAKEQPATLQIGRPTYIGGKYVLPAAMHIRSSSGTPYGTVIVASAIEALVANMEGRIHREAVEFYVLDKAQSVVMTSTGKTLADEEIDAIQQKLSRMALSPHAAGLIAPPSFLNLQGNVAYYQAMEQAPYTVVTAFRKPLLKAARQRAKFNMLVQSLAMAGFTFLILFVIKWLVVRPVQQLSESADHIAHGEEDATLPESPILELQNLANRLDSVKGYTTELRNTQNRLHDANVMVQSSLGYMAHELKTPLTQIMGFSDLLLKKFKDPEDASREYVSYIKEAASLQRQLIDSFLKAAQHEADMSDMETRPIDIKALLRSRLQILRHLAHEKKVKIQEECPATLPMLLGDEIRLGQVLLNFASNGVKYNKQEGTLTVKVELEEATGGLVIHFIDTGIGIKQEDQERLFQKFQRIENEQTRDIEGTGLGLSFSKEVIELHEGTITMQSKEGEGTTLSLHFPSKRLVEEPR